MGIPILNTALTLLFSAQMKRAAPEERPDVDERPAKRARLDAYVQGILDSCPVDALLARCMEEEHARQDRIMGEAARLWEDAFGRTWKVDGSGIFIEIPVAHVDTDHGTPQEICAALQKLMPHRVIASTSSSDATEPKFYLRCYGTGKQQQ